MSKVKRLRLSRSFTTPPQTSSTDGIRRNLFSFILVFKQCSLCFKNFFLKIMSQTLSQDFQKYINIFIILNKRTQRISNKTHCHPWEKPTKIFKRYLSRENNKKNKKNFTSQNIDSRKSIEFLTTHKKILAMKKKLGVI